MDNSQTLQTAAAQCWTDFIRFKGDILEIGGWLLRPGNVLAAVEFVINGRVPAQTNYPLPRPDLTGKYRRLGDNVAGGFFCRTRMSEAEAFPTGGPLLLQVRDKNTREILCSFYHPRNIEDGLPFPETAQRQRVHGSDRERGFILAGYNAFMNLNAALKESVGKDLSSFARLLDWGCGCGRLTRHLRSLQRVAIHGADVDADNVTWCRHHLPFAQFSTLPLHPPAPLPSASFDVVIGISVLTHLREQEQFEWLGELRRLCADGAVLLLTVQGATSIAGTALTDADLELWSSKGFFDCRNKQMDGIIAEPEYYRSTFHTPAYIHREWSRFFEILAIVPGRIGHQDLVILRNNSAQPPS